jgi:DNA-binding transcriptional ArsR family regulator
VRGAFLMMVVFSVLATQFGLEAILGAYLAEVPQLTRFGVMRHLGVLEQAGLVVTHKQGRHKFHYLNPVPIRMIYERWIDKYRARQAAALLDLKGQLEGRR